MTAIAFVMVPNVRLLQKFVKYKEFGGVNRRIQLDAVSEQAEMMRPMAEPTGVAEP